MNTIFPLMSRLRRIELKILLCFWGYSILLLLLLSPDSYLHDLYCRCDSAWFFTAGKWWMQGLKPYIDFSDSKGPLLWFIYGLGWLISHYDYIGVWWLSTLSYAATFYFVYRSAYIFTSRRTAIICSLVMTFAFFLYPFHREIRAEDWCNLFLTLSLWKMCEICYGNNMPKSTIRYACFWLGFSTGALLLIKYNIAAMQAIMPLIVIWVMNRKHHGLRISIMYEFLGFLTSTLPFILVLVFEGCFMAMINEYFLATSSFYSKFFAVESFLNNELIKDLLRNKLFNLYELCILLGMILATVKLKTLKWTPIICILWMILVIVPSAHLIYHFRPLSLVYFPFILSCLTSNLYLKTEKLFTKTRYLIALAFFCIIVDYSINHTCLDSTIVWNNDKQCEHVYYASAQVLSQYDHPTICYNSVEQGVETLADALPGMKYWCIPNHKREEGETELAHIIEQNLVDVVLIFGNSKKAISSLEQKGYHKCFTMPYHSTPWSVWSKRKLPKPQLDYEASWQDVLFKRRPHFVKTHNNKD